MNIKSSKKMRCTISLLFTSLLISISDASMANNTAVLDISLPSSVFASAVYLSEPDLNHINNDTYSQLLLLSKKSSGNVFTHFQDRYLTLHYGKTEKIKAVYKHGAYGISYQQKW